MFSAARENLSCKKDCIRDDKHHHGYKQIIEAAGLHDLPCDAWKSE
ncbi:hypothetical protein ABIA28_007310 [Bradyrhizobium elkanii]